MRSSTTLYSGRTTLGTRTFGQLNTGTTAGSYIETTRLQSQFCPLHCQRVGSYAQLNALRNAIRYTYGGNQDTLQNNKNALVSGLDAKLDLKDVCVISNLNTNISPTPISKTAIPYLNYNIDPNGSLFGNAPCGLSNFTNYKVSNNFNLNKINKL